MANDSLLIFSVIVNVVVGGAVVALFFYLLFFSPTPRQIRDELKRLKEENDQLKEEVSGLREVVAEQSVEIRNLRQGRGHHSPHDKHKGSPLTALAEKIRNSFDESELNDLLVQFDLSAEMITGKALSDKCLNLVTYFNRRGELGKLRAALRDARPKGDW
jgi:hypothetical protein